MSIQELQKENELLKSLSQTLERENNSRAEENKILLQELDRLTAENESLLKKMDLNSRNSQSYQIESQKVSTLEKKISEMDTIIKNISEENNSLHAERLRLNSQIQRLSDSNKNEPQVERILNERIRTLIGENEELDSLLRDSEQNHKISMSEKEKTHKIQLQTKQRQIQLKIQENVQLSRQAEVKGMQIAEKNAQILSLRQKIKQQDNSLKNSENMQVRSLKYANAELQNKISTLQRQNSNYVKKIRELEVQLVDKSAIIVKKTEESNELQRIKMSQNAKDQQIRNLTSIISNLKRNEESHYEKIQSLEQELCKNERMIGQMERKGSTDAANNDLMAKMEHKIRILQSQLAESEISRSKSKNEDEKVNEEIVRQNEQLNQIIYELQNENKRMYQVMEQNRMNAYGPKSVNNSRSMNDESQLRTIVEDLRHQLYDVRSDFKKMNSENQRLQQLITHQLYNNSGKYSPKISKIHDQPMEYSLADHHHVNNRYNHQFPSRIKSQIKTQITKRHSYDTNQHQLERKKPQYKPQKLGDNRNILRQDNPLDSPSFAHKEKWSALQKRINQLRSENEELKQSLCN